MHKKFKFIVEIDDIGHAGHAGFQVTSEGRTLFGEKATRDVWVCDAGAYVTLKALAFDNRDENKDAYDLFYVIRNYGSGIGDVVSSRCSIAMRPPRRWTCSGATSPIQRPSAPGASLSS